MTESTTAPAVTVLIATFNRARDLDAAIRSVLDQSLPRRDFEVIVVDDGSTDDTLAVLARYGSQIIVLARAHEGVEAACNAGIASARGRYIVRVDSDDVVERDLLLALTSALDACDDAVAVSCDFFEDTGDASRLLRVRDDNLFDRIGCGVLMRTDLVRAVGGYRRTFWEEYDLFLRLRDRGPILHVARPLYRYRRHQTNRTLDDAQRTRGWLELIEQWGLDRLRTFGSHEELERVARSVAAGRR
jgi:glycosyltransferase involved in cell wall biosynthesis